MASFPVATLCAEFGDELLKLTASDGDSLWESVAISGNTAIAGGFPFGDGRGSAYVFDATTGEQLWKLTASDAASFDHFGSSVAISGTRTVVGARLKGAAYVFDVTTGQELLKLTASDTATRPYFFGSSVAISGTTAVVGASAGGDSSGAAYVFDVVTGQELWKVTASDSATGAEFGSSVAISGNKVIVGDWGNDSAGNNAGAVYVYDITTRQQLWKLSASDSAPELLFGSDVAMTGTTAVVGASGAAYLFDLTTGEEVRKLAGSDVEPGNTFRHVAINDNTAILGAPFDDDFGHASGAAYVFDVSTGQQLAKLTASDAAAGQTFGRGVGISGDLAVVASPALLSETAGSAYVFDVTRNLSSAGDFNTDGTVDAADYIVWRNGLGTTYTQSDYDDWRANFGRSAATAASAPGSAAGSTPTVPEPSALLLMTLALAPLLSKRGRG
jgi:outer membrane protein assembly factor BamB